MQTITKSDLRISYYYWQCLVVLIAIAVSIYLAGIIMTSLFVGTPDVYAMGGSLEGISAKMIALLTRFIGLGILLLILEGGYYILQRFLDQQGEIHEDV